MDFLGTVRAFARREGLWRRGDRLLAAVSGGPDSLALLLALDALRESEGFHLACCTVNHCLREEAADDARFVVDVCAERGIPCRVETADVPAWRKAHGGSEEEAARTLRYEALRRAARALDCTAVAAAHQKDDQAETVLFHFLRGSGSAGLAGMRPRRGRLIRPFLCVTRRDIEEYLKGYPYEPRHDRTNDIPCASRNRLRLLLMPELARYNPNLTDTLCRTAEIFRGEDDYLESEAARYEDELTGGAEGLSAEAALFRRLPPALAGRLLRRIWLRTGGRAPDFAGTERMLAFLRKGANGKWTSAAGTAVRIEGGRAFFYAGSTRAETAFPQDGGGWTLSQAVTEERPEPAGTDTLVLDADAVGTVRLRCPRPGDVFAPAGFAGTKKLFPYMNELHIPAPLRKSWPLAADEHHIYWIGGKKASRFGAPAGHTRRYLILTLRRNGHGKPDERH